VKTDYIVERRVVPLGGVEMRQEGDGLLSFSGHAAVFDQLVDLGPWREQIAPGAFKKTIKDGTDVRFLYNHEPDSVMARTKNGTLRLAEDRVGLVAEADLDPTDWDVQRLAPKLRRGDVDQMSFAFRVVGKAGETWDDDPEDGGKSIRTLKEVALFDTSPVTYPAYPSTDGGLRQSIEAVAERRGIVYSWDDDQAEIEVERAEDLGIFTSHLTEPERAALADFVNTLIAERDAGAGNQEDAGETDAKDTGASSPVTEDATAPSGDSAPAADEPGDDPATPAPRTYDAETLWARLYHIKNTL